MSIEIGSAYVSIIPSARGLAANLGRELAPIEGIAARQGVIAGKALSGGLTSALGQISPGATSLLKRITTGLASPAGMAALVTAGFVGLVAVGKQFASVNRIIRQETGATGKTLTGLGQTVKRVFADSPESLKQVTQAVDELFKRGVPLGGMLQKLAEQELFLSKITGSDLGATVEETTALFAKFNIPVRDQSRELDVLFKAQQQSGKGLDELLGGLKRAGSVLQQFGFNLDESTALVAGLEKAGVNVQPALAGLRLAFGKITQAGGRPKQVLHDLIGELTSGKNPTDAMAKAIKLFGNRSGAELAIAIQKGKLSITDMLKTITDGKGGIIATGEATLTLAEKFTIFKHRALLDLQDFGAKALDVFKQVVNQGGPILGDLIGSVTRLVQQLAPALAPIGLLLVGTFKVALPVVELLARDIGTVADALDHVSGPVKAGAVVFGLLALAAFGAADGLIAAGRAAVVASVEFAFTPVGAAVLAFGALVTAVTLFGKSADPAKKEAKDLGKAMFDASNDAGIFASGIANATDGITQFLKSRIDAGKDHDLEDALTKGGSSITELVGHLGEGKDAWRQYREAVAIAASGTSENTRDQITNLVEFGKSLQKQRDAFVDSAKAQLRFRIASGQLKASQLDAIKATDKNRDGTINYGKVLDDVNTKLARLQQQTDATAQATAQSSPIYKDLVTQFASGKISADELAGVLKGSFKFSADGAKAAAKTLADQVKALADEVDKSFPAIADAAKNLKTDVGATARDLVNRQAVFVHQYAALSAQGGQASQQLKDAIVSNNRGIRADLKVLADDTDPERFTANILKQVQNISAFFANIKTLVSEGFPELARTLLDMGVQAGGSLAAGFASKPSVAKAGNAALGLLNSTKGSMHQWVLDHFAELQGIGGQIPAGVASGIDSNTHTATAAAGRMGNAVKGYLAGNFRIFSPSKWARDVIGKNIVLGVGEGLDPALLAAQLKRFTSTVQSGLVPPVKTGPTFGAGARSDVLTVLSHPQDPGTRLNLDLANVERKLDQLIVVTGKRGGVHIDTLNARDDEDVARVIVQEQRRAYLLTSF